MTAPYLGSEALTPVTPPPALAPPTSGALAPRRGSTHLRYRRRRRGRHAEADALRLTKSAGDPTCATASSSHRFKTIAAALACANNGTTLKLLAGTYAGELTVAHNVTVVGAGASTVIAGSTDFLDLTPDVTVAPRAEVTLEDLTVDGINQTAPGVVAHSGRVTMIGATITRSGSIGQSTPLAGGLSIVPGAGSAAEATVYDSTIDHDLAQFSGGGILVDPVTGGTSPASALAILNSTIADNTAQGSGGGGGLWISQAGATLRDSTITGNTAEGGGGGGIRGNGETGLDLVNAILAANTAASGPDCSSLNTHPQASGGHNVIGRIGSGSGAGCQTLDDDGVNGDQVGSALDPLDPQLAPLGTNGGPTRTMALLAASPAAGAGSAADAKAWPISDEDQRGSPRHSAARGASDVGAYDTGG